MAVLPLMLLLKLLEWAGIFLISVASVVFNLLAGLFFLVGVASYILGLTAGSEALKMQRLSSASISIRAATS